MRHHLKRYWTWLMEHPTAADWSYCAALWFNAGMVVYAFRDTLFK